MAKEDGIQIKLPGFATNSRLALEASEFSKTKEKFLDCHTAIYEAYLVHGRNIGDKQVILELAEDVGLDKNELDECLIKRSMFDKIENNKREAEDRLILGVPTFVFGDFPLHGNQSTQTLRDVIKRSLERTGS